MPFACSACGSPAITLPKELHHRAPVHCQGCGVLIATWAVFKHSTIQVVLADIKEAGARGHALSYDPLDPGLLRRVQGVLDT